MRSRRIRKSLARHRAVVVEPQQLDHLADVGLVLDPARSRPAGVREDRMGHDPALRPELVPDVLGESEVGDVVAVQVTDLAATDLECDRRASARSNLDSRPRPGGLDDLLAWRFGPGHGRLLRVCGTTSLLTVQAQV